MAARSHSLAREGSSVGLVGAAVVALWFFVVDLARGTPLRTPNAFGHLLFGQTPPTPGGPADLGIVLAWTIVFFLAFAVFGIALTGLVHLVSEHPEFRMGLWIGLLVGFLLVTGLMYVLHEETGERLVWWVGAGGSLLAVAAMGTVLWRRHPALGHQDAPLGDEVPPPPHAPGPPEPHTRRL